MGAQPGPEEVLERRLRAFRGRNLWRFGLGLCFAAALCNEGYRWGSIVVGAWLGLEFPQLNVGPYFLAAAFLLVRRRWSPGHTAARADAADRFLDRFVSYREFARRPQLAAAIREAQAQEAVRALAGVPPWGPHPARTLLLAGPLLLAVSMLYPMLAVTPLSGPSLRGPGGRTGYRLGDGPDATKTLPPSHLETRPVEDRQAQNKAPEPPRPDGGDERQKPPRPDAAAEKRLPGPGEKTGPADGTSPANLMSPRTERVSAQEPKIVDPVFSPAEAAAAKPKPQIRGSVGYRLLPANRAGDAGGGSAGAGEAGRGTLVIDYDAVPEEYRPLVRGYFDRLAQVAAAPAGKERNDRD